MLDPIRQACQIQFVNTCLLINSNICTATIKHRFCSTTLCSIKWAFKQSSNEIMHTTLIYHERGCPILIFYIIIQVQLPIMIHMLFRSFIAHKLQMLSPKSLYLFHMKTHLPCLYVIYNQYIAISISFIYIKMTACQVTPLQVTTSRLTVETPK